MLRSTALTTFTYMGYAVDGTAANFGTAPNVLGDKNLDGFVKGTFLPQPGAYSFFVGGANYADQAPTADAGIYGVQTTVSAVAPVPEPTPLALLASAGVLALAARSRKGRG